MTHLLLAANNGTNLDPIYSKALFWILAILSVGAAITMIFMRQAVHCALMLAIVMLSLAVLYAMQATATRKHVPGEDEVTPGAEQATHSGQEAEL